MQKGGAFQAGVDEGGLHARQYPTHLAFIDVADQAALGGTLDDDLLYHAVFDHCHAGLGWGDVDQDFFTHGISLHTKGTAHADGAQDLQGFEQR